MTLGKTKLFISLVAVANSLMLTDPIPSQQSVYIVQCFNLWIENIFGAVVVAQLVERLLPIPEVRDSNPVIGKKLNWIFTVNCIETTKIKKRGREWPISKKNYLSQIITLVDKKTK